MNYELLLAVVAQVATAASVYAALRADLARAITLAEGARDAAESAHRRIDGVVR